VPVHTQQRVHRRPVSGLCRTTTFMVALLVAGVAGTACSGSISEPGTPPQDPSPLFGGFKSYETLDEAKRALPERASWHVVFDSNSSQRANCPRFDEFTFDVRAEDFGQSGTLRLVFINQRLQTTSFMPQDFSQYVAALVRNGLVGESGEGRIPPATDVWLSDAKLGTQRFVGWEDHRFSAQVRAFVFRCS